MGEDQHRCEWKPSYESGGLTGDDESSRAPSTLTYMTVRVASGDAERMTESGGEPEMTATRLSRSVARRLDCELASALRLALDVVMDGSVAEARSSRGLLLVVLRGDESLLCMRRGSDDGEPMASFVWDCGGCGGGRVHRERSSLPAGGMRTLST
jgi:hypothetical protein